MEIFVVVIFWIIYISKCQIYHYGGLELWDDGDNIFFEDCIISSGEYVCVGMKEESTKKKILFAVFKSDLSVRLLKTIVSSISNLVATAIVEGSDENFYVTANSGAGDGFVFKIDSTDGNIMWHHMYIGQYDFYSVIISSSDKLIVGGTYMTCGPSALMLTITLSGVLEESRVIDMCNDNFENVRIIESSEGTGYIFGGGASDGDFSFIRTDGSGNNDWGHRILDDDPNYRPGLIHEIIPYGSGEYVAIGTAVNGVFGKSVFFRFNEAGVFSFVKELFVGSASNYALFETIEEVDGGFYLAGTTHSLLGEESVLAKIDDEGELLWATRRDSVSIGTPISRIRAIERLTTGPPGALTRSIMGGTVTQDSTSDFQHLFFAVFDDQHDAPRFDTDIHSGSTSSALSYSTLIDVTADAALDGSISHFESGTMTEVSILSTINGAETVLNYTWACEENYFGRFCNLSLCDGIPGNDSNVCDSHGACVALDVCECKTGYFNSTNETSCDSWSCKGIFVHDDEGVDSICGGHGTCESYDNCNCSTGYGGSDCTQYSCYGIPSAAEDICNKRGDCIGPDVCLCHATGEDSFYQVVGGNCEAHMGKHFTRASKNTLAVYFEVLIQDALNFVPEEDLMYETFPCDWVLTLDESSTPYFRERGSFFRNCSLSNKYEERGFTSTIQLLFVHLDHIDEDRLVDIFEIIEDRFVVLVNGRTRIEGRVFPQQQVLEELYQDGLTLRVFSQSEEVKDGKNEQTWPSSSNEKCKSKLLLYEDCVEQHFECKKTKEDEGDEFGYYRIGFIPSTSSSEYLLTRFYYSTSEDCDDGINVRNFQTFSMVSCSGSPEMKDTFIMYSVCRNRLSSLLFTEQVAIYFVTGTAPMYLSVCILLLCCSCCWINCSLFCGRKILMTFGINMCWKNDKTQKKNKVTSVDGGGKGCESETIEEMELEYLEKFVQHQDQGEQEFDGVQRARECDEGKKDEAALIETDVRSDQKEEDDDDEFASESSEDGSMKEEEEEGGGEKEEEEEDDDEEEEEEEDDEEEDEDDEEEEEEIYSTEQITNEEGKSESTESGSESEESNSTEEDSEGMKEKVTDDDDEGNSTSSKLNNYSRIIRKGVCCCCTCCTPRICDFFKCLAMLLCIIVKEGIMIYFSCAEFMDDSDVDPSNDNFVFLGAALATNRYVLLVSIVVYLFLLSCVIGCYVVPFVFSPIMLSVSYGAVKEFVYFRIMKSMFLLWFICLNLYSYILKFGYSDRFERENMLSDIYWWFAIVLPETLLLFLVWDVLGYNGVSSNAQYKKLLKLGCWGYLRFPRVSIGWGQVTKDADSILDDFFQVLFLLDEKLFISTDEDNSGKTSLEDKRRNYDSKKVEEFIKECSESTEYGHLSFEYLDGLSCSEIMYLRNFFFPKEFEKQTYWNIFHHQRVNSRKWCLAFFCFPLACLLGWDGI